MLLARRWPRRWPPAISRTMQLLCSELGHNSGTHCQWGGGSRITMATNFGRIACGSAAVNQDDDRKFIIVPAKGGDTNISCQDIAKCTTLLIKLRILKSKLEGTYFKLQPLALDHNKLAQLKHLVVSYTPSTLHEEAKTQISKHLEELFRGQVKKLLYACILTCPWFASAHSKVSAQAKNNLLFVVFSASSEEFYCLSTSHAPFCNDFLFATDVRRFCSQLQHGNVRSIEALCAPPSSLVLCSREWLGLVGLMDPVDLLQRRSVVDCLGKAINVLTTKRARRELVFRDKITQSMFYDFVRLLGYAECVLKQEPICPWTEIATESDQHKDICVILKQAFEGDLKKEQLLKLVLNLWEKRVLMMNALGQLPEKHTVWSTALGQWLSEIRMDGVEVTQTPDLQLCEENHFYHSCNAHPDDEKARNNYNPFLGTSATYKLVQLLSSFDLPSMDPANILVLAKAGSHMYGLSNPTSDTDYLMVYRQPTKDMISACTIPKECHIGQKQKEEIVAYEARLFGQMLLKGSVNMIELLFAAEVTYATDEWKALVAHKGRFLSEVVILQYQGFVQARINTINNDMPVDNRDEGKIFYHIFHKLLSLEQFAYCNFPIVKCSGEDRDFILRVRRGPLKGELSKKSLNALAKQRLASVKEHLAKRTIQFSEYGDYQVLQAWLLAVRGVNLKDPANLTIPPLFGH